MLTRKITPIFLLLKEPESGRNTGPVHPADQRQSSSRRFFIKRGTFEAKRSFLVPLFCVLTRKTPCDTLERTDRGLFENDTLSEQSGKAVFRSLYAAVLEQDRRKKCTGPMQNGAMSFRVST